MAKSHYSSTRAYRMSYPYREMYFKQNPGIFGCIWICSQCYRPIFGKKNVVIDHIVPLNKGGKNDVSNCTACCRSCNSHKSDIVDYRVVKGKIFKVFESNAYRAQRGIGAILMFMFSLVASAIGFVTGRGRKGYGKRGRQRRRGKSLPKRVASVACGGLKVLTWPIRKGTAVSRLFFLVLYTLVVVTLLQMYTPIFNAWL